MNQRSLWLLVLFLWFEAIANVSNAKPIDLTYDYQCKRVKQQISTGWLNNDPDVVYEQAKKAPPHCLLPMIQAYTESKKFALAKRLVIRAAQFFDPSRIDYPEILYYKLLYFKSGSQVQQEFDRERQELRARNKDLYEALIQQEQKLDHPHTCVDVEQALSMGRLTLEEWFASNAAMRLPNCTLELIESHSDVTKINPDIWIPRIEMMMERMDRPQKIRALSIIFSIFPSHVRDKHHDQLQHLNPEAYERMRFAALKPVVDRLYTFYTDPLSVACPSYLHEENSFILKFLEELRQFSRCNLMQEYAVLTNREAALTQANLKRIRQILDAIRNWYPVRLNESSVSLPEDVTYAIKTYKCAMEHQTQLASAENQMAGLDERISAAKDAYALASRCPMVGKHQSHTLLIELKKQKEEMARRIAMERREILAFFNSPLSSICPVHSESQELSPPHQSLNLWNRCQEAKQAREFLNNSVDEQGIVTTFSQLEVVAAWYPLIIPGDPANTVELPENLAQFVEDYRCARHYFELLNQDTAHGGFNEKLKLFEKASVLNCSLVEPVVAKTLLEQLQRYGKDLCAYFEQPLTTPCPVKQNNRQLSAVAKKLRLEAYCSKAEKIMRQPVKDQATASTALTLINDMVSWYPLHLGEEHVPIPEILKDKQKRFACLNEYYGLMEQEETTLDLRLASVNRALNKAQECGLEEQASVARRTRDRVQAKWERLKKERQQAYAKATEVFSNPLSHTCPEWNANWTNPFTTPKLSGYCETVANLHQVLGKMLPISDKLAKVLEYYPLETYGLEEVIKKPQVLECATVYYQNVEEAQATESCQDRKIYLEEAVEWVKRCSLTDYANAQALLAEDCQEPSIYEQQQILLNKIKEGIAKIQTPEDVRDHINIWWLQLDEFSTTASLPTDYVQAVAILHEYDHCIRERDDHFLTDWKDEACYRYATTSEIGILSQEVFSAGLTLVNEELSSLMQNWANTVLAEPISDREEDLEKKWFTNVRDAIQCFDNPLFLDRIGDLPIESQLDQLRAILRIRLRLHEQFLTDPDIQALQDDLKHVPNEIREHNGWSDFPVAIETGQHPLHEYFGYAFATAVAQARQDNPYYDQMLTFWESDELRSGADADDLDRVLQDWVGKVRQLAFKPDRCAFDQSDFDQILQRVFKASSSVQARGMDNAKKALEPIIAPVWLRFIVTEPILRRLLEAGCYAEAKRKIGDTIAQDAKVPKSLLNVLNALSSRATFLACLELKEAQNRFCSF